MSKKTKHKMPLYIPPFTLIAYHRDKKRNPIGCVVAALVDGTIRLGCSLCDKEDRQKGLFSKHEAISRALIATNDPIVLKVPTSLRKTVDRMKARVEKYYPSHIPRLD